ARRSSLRKRGRGPSRRSVFRNRGPRSGARRLRRTAATRTEDEDGAGDRPQGRAVLGAAAGNRADDAVAPSVLGVVRPRIALVRGLELDGAEAGQGGPRR